MCNESSSSRAPGTGMPGRAPASENIRALNIIQGLRETRTANFNNLEKPDEIDRARYQGNMNGYRTADSVGPNLSDLRDQIEMSMIMERDLKEGNIQKEVAFGKTMALRESYQALKVALP